MSFTLDINKYVKKTDENLGTFVRGVVMGLAERIDERSPVGDADYWKSAPPVGYVGGHFRMNNQYTFGSPPNNEIDGVDPRSSKIALDAIMVKVKVAPVAGIHYIANNVPYAVAIENGHSKNQAPKGVYGLAVIDIDNILRDEIAKMK